MNPRLTSLILALFFSSCVSAHGWGQAQEKIQLGKDTFVKVRSPWQLVTVDTQASLRGLHVRTADEIWASGTDGTIINSTDAGKTWRVRVVPGAEELDFRDIHAIDDGTIVAMTSGTPARIYRSTNGGTSWKMCFESTDKRIFLDALSFVDDQFGLVMGDPIDGKIFLLGTDDSGKTWRRFLKVPATKPGEAGFAASGTNMITSNDGHVLIALGSHLEGESAESSRVLISPDRGKNWRAATVPIPRAQSAGIFSLVFASQKHGVAVGGDYQIPDGTTGNYAVTADGGLTWKEPKPRRPPSGYRSCVTTWINGREINLVTVGPNGTDLSGDLGSSWKRVSNEGFHAIDFDNEGQHGWATGSDGRVARWLGVVNTNVLKPGAPQTRPAQPGPPVRRRRGR